MKISSLTLMAIFLIAGSLFSQESNKSEFPVLSGPYLGQDLPGLTAELFAPGIISDGLTNRDVAISPDGKEMYFGLHTADFSYSTIIVTKEVKGVWTKPEVVTFASDPRYIYLEPAFSSDGQTMYFLSNMPKDSTENPADEDIWVVDRKDDGWGKPYNLGEPINTDGSEFFPSLTNDGTMYFTRAEAGERVNFIYRSKLVNGTYQTPEKLPAQVNCGINRFNAYIAPDESFMVIPVLGMEDALGGVDYYIVFRNEDDTWEEPINMGPQINSATGAEWSLSLSPDQKYMFYMATKGLPDDKKPKSLSVDFFQSLLSIPQNGSADIYWIDAKIIDELRP
jgi:hypothetical protein